MPRASGFDAMDLGDILTKDQVVTDLGATNRWEAIDELINNLVATGKIKPEHRDAIAAVVKKRESSMSTGIGFGRSEEHTSELQSQSNLVCRLLLEKKKKKQMNRDI